ncbi:MAG: tRNA pseudouridine(55) synthase TruB [Candidatus Marinimicrobia bacterium]|jgi:tRNA pseudouridine55 synthase|nr:tRNA pseudouridine(55) synthase TruB [Candidatus Neomarinimicrobiota bacterium]MBT3936289.1 tRNA pseudouridine(55) synthase TruB [Candidatus Neomarinimicrobiota bacterium]MBT4637110.1 tRNA pseudouridine(55) synthase TruB [Candidatus Neomarinimicrobiota bacterium]MBT4685123.1 tRNA pseudouridine(55) synthase TruB [Candidatus Neomarinimicrobiota bacterium]MBT4735372.1 tRNA pseudouridine(55) synthase TruB [Candidatus Neomarinimicrobiota bacterium]
MIININKPVGWTSFDVVKKIRGITKEKKVGHGGTLDPFAEGVLIIGTGKHTKELANVSNSNKSYEAVIKLGQETNTLDTEGDIIETAPIPNLSDEQIQATLESFLGKQSQIPPMFSAKKINGKRLYSLAREGITVERESIEITIEAIKLISFKADEIRLSTTCSKGTYIRVLGSDIARKLGTVGYLIELTRTHVGNANIKESLTIDEFQEKWKSIHL